MEKAANAAFSFAPGKLQGRMSSNEKARIAAGFFMSATPLSNE